MACSARIAKTALGGPGGGMGPEKVGRGGVTPNGLIARFFADVRDIPSGDVTPATALRFRQAARGVAVPRGSAAQLVQRPCAPRGTPRWLIRRSPCQPRSRHQEWRQGVDSGHHSPKPCANGANVASSAMKRCALAPIDPNFVTACGSFRLIVERGIAAWGKFIVAIPPQWFTR